MTPGCHYLLHHPFVQRAASHPERTALILPTAEAQGRLTYGDLERRSVARFRGRVASLGLVDQGEVVDRPPRSG